MWETDITVMVHSNGRTCVMGWMSSALQEYYQVLEYETSDTNVLEWQRRSNDDRSIPGQGGSRERGNTARNPNRGHAQPCVKSLSLSCDAMSRPNRSTPIGYTCSCDGDRSTR